MRKQIVAGNWKMNMTLTEGLQLADSIVSLLGHKEELKAEVILCAPYIHLAHLAEAIKGSKVLCGAQNCASEISGAYTGEVSAEMIKSTGSTYVIIGHSERRTLFGEDNAVLFRKTRLAIEAGLKVIFCCGEILPEREAGNHFEVVEKQLKEGLFDLNEPEFASIVIAYEPVWAIGTGLTASPDQAQEMHNHIRSLVRKHYNHIVSDALTILYGGSCKPSNAAEIFANPDVDGGLIGGASLKTEDFCAIVESI